MFISDAFAQDATQNTTPSVQAIAPTDMPAAPYELTQEKIFKDTLVFLFLLFVVFYFILIRPQQKKFKAHQSMLSDLKKGEEVITGGGLIGRISSFEGKDIVVVEIAKDTTVRIARSSVSGRYFAPDAPTPSEALKATKAEKKAAKSGSSTTANDN